MKTYLKQTHWNQGQEKDAHSPISIQYCTWSASYTIGQQKEIKRKQVGKKDIKVSLLADDMIVSINDPKNSTRELQLINKFSKVARYKINSNKSVAFLYTNY